MLPEEITIMDLSNAPIVGVATVLGLAALSALLVILRLREALSERPDPKLTYAKASDLERTRQEYREEVRLLRRDMEERTGILHERIGHLRDEITASLEAIDRRQELRAQAIEASLKDSAQLLGKLQGAVEANVQVTHQIAAQLHNHVAQHASKAANRQPKEAA